MIATGSRLKRTGVSPPDAPGRSPDGKYSSKASSSSAPRGARASVVVSVEIDRNPAPAPPRASGRRKSGSTGPRDPRGRRRGGPATTGAVSSVRARSTSSRGKPEPARSRDTGRDAEGDRFSAAVTAPRARPRRAAGGESQEQPAIRAPASDVDDPMSTSTAPRAEKKCRTGPPPSSGPGGWRPRAAQRSRPRRDAVAKRARRRRVLTVGRRVGARPARRSRRRRRRAAHFQRSPTKSRPRRPLAGRPDRLQLDHRNSR